MSFDLGLIGAGFIGHPLATHVDTHDQLTVTAVADIDPEARNRTSESLNVPDTSRFESWEALLEETSLDGVLIATPPAVREAPIRSAADRGLTIYTEKPLATKAAAAARICETVETHDVEVGVGFQRRLHPGYAWLRSHRGASPPELVSGYLGMDWVPGLEETWKTDEDVPGSGFLFDTGIHLVDAALWVSGITPTRVTASTQQHPVHGVDICGAIIIEGDGGEIINLTLDARAPSASEEVQISLGSGISSVQRDRLLDGGGMLGNFSEEIIRTSQQGIEIQQCGDDFAANKAEAVAGLLAGGETTGLATVSEASIATVVCECALESANNERTVFVSDLSSSADIDG